MAHTAALETSPANHRILERSLGAARFLQGPPLDIDHYKWVRGVLPRLERRQVLERDHADVFLTREVLECTRRRRGGRSCRARAGHERIF